MEVYGIMTEQEYWSLLDRVDFLIDEVFYNGDEEQIQELEEDMNEFIRKWSGIDGDNS